MLESGALDDDEEAEPKDPLEDPVPSGQAQIDQILGPNGNGRIIFYMAGIYNANLSDTDEARSAIAENQWAGWGNVVPVTNNNNAKDAFSFTPNEQAAANLATLIKYALDHGAKPAQITIVAHSNGTPTLGVALSKIDQNVKFGEILIFAPNSRDPNLIRNIAARSSGKVYLIVGVSDAWAGWQSLGGQGPAEWVSDLKKAGVRGVTMNDVYGNRIRDDRDEHSVKGYVNAIKRNEYREYLIQ